MAALVAALVPAAARADGLPVLGVDVGSTGVASSSDGARYVTVPAGSNTIIEQVAQQGGQVVAWRSLPGTFTIPAVAYDGSAGGLSADGRTLVLIEPRKSFPRAATKLLVLSSDGLKPLRAVRLQGDFSFDAVSPDGSSLYLIHYVSPQDPTRYLVQAYDMRRGRLIARPIVDPNNPGEKMRGNPLSRAMSAPTAAGRTRSTTAQAPLPSYTPSTPSHGQRIASISTGSPPVPTCGSYGLASTGTTSA
jgi:hypothetical protein